jgi:hypothetical protein
MPMELCLTVTIYDRDDWMGGLIVPVKPAGEKVFTSEVPDEFAQVDLAIALRLACNKANDWLNKQRVDLVSQVVVTLYSLEVK